MPPLRLAFLAFVIAPASPCSTATPPVIPDALQQEAMTCVGEAAQICPEVWTAEDHGIACMIGKRQAFSPRCQVIYDEVAHALHVTPHDSAKPHGP